MQTGDEGFQALEVALLFPVIVLITIAAVVGVRLQSANNEVLGAARSAARAASVGGPETATFRAERAAERSISVGSAHCVDGPVVELRYEARATVTTVRATVSCSVRLADLGFGMRRTVVAAAEQPIDELVSQ
jgi:guanyl-specific ribonuclease Sa